MSRGVEMMWGWASDATKWPEVLDQILAGGLRR